MLLSLPQPPPCVGTIAGTSLSPQVGESVPAAVLPMSLILLLPRSEGTSTRRSFQHVPVRTGSCRLLLCVSGPSFRVVVWGVSWIINTCAFCFPPLFPAPLCLFVCLCCCCFFRFSSLPRPGPFSWHPYSSNASVMDVMSVALLAPSVLLLCFPLLTASVLTVALVARPSDPGNHPRHGVLLGYANWMLASFALMPVRTPYNARW